MLGGDVALDFINTASEWSSGDPVDRLGDLSGFVAWAEAAGLGETVELARTKEEIRSRPAEAAAVFADAVSFRATLWRIFEAASHGRRADRGDLTALRDRACRAGRFRDLEQTDDRCCERWTRDAPALETPLLAIALSAEALLKEGRLDRLHVCGGDGCEWMFLDLSKNASRRWCSMATCGNSAKVKNFRKRKGEQGVAPRADKS
jgi:predicted RNA-binding Zn ribbon-like protein